MQEKNLEEKIKTKNNVTLLTKIKNSFRKNIALYSLMGALTFGGGYLVGCESEEGKEDTSYSQSTNNSDKNTSRNDNNSNENNNSHDNSSGNNINYNNSCQPCQSSADCGNEQSCLKWKNYSHITWCADACYDDRDCPTDHSCGNSGYCKPMLPGETSLEDVCEGNYVVKRDSCDNLLEETFCEYGCQVGTCLSSNSNSTTKILIDNLPDEVHGSDVAGWYNSLEQECKLNTTLLSWNLNMHCKDSEAYPPSAQDIAFQAACETWAKYLTIDCEKIGPYDKPRVKAYFYPNGEEACSYSEAIACANYPCTNDQFLHYNDGFIFTLNLEEAENDHSKIDFQSITLHELGHTIGLPHTDDEEAVMNKYYKPQRYLTQTDIDMLVELYGN